MYHTTAWNMYNITFIYADCPHHSGDQIQKSVQKADMYCLYQM